MDERALADNLDRFLDELATGPAGDRSMLDPELTDIARRYRAVGRMPAPAGTRTRVWQGLAGQTNGEKKTPEIGPISSNGTAATSRRSGGTPAAGHTGSERRWSIVPLAMAAVLLLIGLGIGYAVFGAGWFDDEPRSTIPAAVAPAATPAPPSYTEESLLEMTIPAELLPRGEITMGGLNHIAWNYGPLTTWDASRGANNPGLRFEYVVAGSYTVEVAGPALLLRAGAEARETIPADTPLTLEPGDALAFANDVGATYEKSGETGVELLFWIVFDASNGAYSTDPIPLAWNITDLDLQTSGLSAPAGPATLRLRRVELAAEAEFPPRASGDMQFSVGLTAENLAGTPLAYATLARSSDGSVRNGARRTTFVVLTLEPAESTGTPPP